MNSENINEELSLYNFLQLIIATEDNQKAKKSLFQFTNKIKKEAKIDLLYSVHSNIGEFQKCTPTEVEFKEGFKSIQTILNNPIKKLWLAEIFDQWLKNTSIFKKWRATNHDDEFHNFYIHLSLDEISNLNIHKQFGTHELNNYKFKNLLMQKIMESYSEEILLLDLNLTPKDDKEFQEITNKYLEKMFLGFDFDHLNGIIDFIVSPKNNPIFAHTNHYKLHFLEAVSYYIDQKNKIKHHKIKERWEPYDVEKNINSDNISGLYYLIKGTGFSFKKILDSKILSNLSLTKEDAFQPFTDCYTNLSLDDKKEGFLLYCENKEFQKKFSEVKNFIIGEYESWKGQHNFTEKRMVHNFYTISLFYPYIDKNYLSKLSEQTSTFNFSSKIENPESVVILETSLTNIINSLNASNPKNTQAETNFKYYYLQFLAIHYAEKPEIIKDKIEQYHLDISLSSEFKKNIFNKIQHKKDVGDVLLYKVFLDKNLIDKKLFIGNYMFNYIEGNQYTAKNCIFDDRKINALMAQNIFYQNEIFEHIEHNFKIFFNSSQRQDNEGHKIIYSFLNQPNFLPNLLEKIVYQMQKPSEDSYANKDIFYTHINLDSIESYLSSPLNIQPQHNSSQFLKVQFSDQQVQGIIQATKKPMFCLNKLKTIEFLLNNISNNQINLLSTQDENLADIILNNCLVLLDKNSENNYSSDYYYSLKRSLEKQKELSIGLLILLEKHGIKPKNFDLNESWYTEAKIIKKQEDKNIFFESTTLKVLNITLEPVKKNKKNIL